MMSLVAPDVPQRASVLRGTVTRSCQEANVSISAAMHEIRINASQGIRTCNCSSVTARSLGARKPSLLWLWLCLHKGPSKVRRTHLRHRPSDRFGAAAGSTHVQICEYCARESRVGISSSAFQCYGLFGSRAAAGVERAVSMAAWWQVEFGADGSTTV